MKYQFNTWAIATGKGNGYIGRYWWWDGKPPIIPYQFHGCIVCLFKNRKMARKYLPQVKGDSIKGLFPNAKVVRVRVTLVREIK